MTASKSSAPDTAGRRFAIIGAGISGLSAAQTLLQADPSSDVTIFEAKDRCGGIIHTIREDGFLLELGPDSFITNKPAAIRLCEDIGFSDQLIPTDNQHRRSLVLHDGRPVAVPDGFLLMAPSDLSAVATTPILSKAGRLRLLQESQIPPAPEITDESLANFVRRRFGQETLDRLVQPLVGGIYTSDPEKLSIQATLPRFQQMEQRYGSVTVATLIQKLLAEGTTAKSSDDDPSNNVTAESTASSGARYGLFAAPKAGMSSLIDSLQQWVTSHDRVHLRLKTRILEIEPLDLGGQLTLADRSQPSFDGIIITLPTHQAASLLNRKRAGTLIDELSGIEYASSSIVVSTHSLSDFEHPLDAFGLVIPMRERRDILAVSFSSRKFPGRAPDGQIILRTFVGGATQPHLMELDDEQIKELVQRELTELLGMKRPPSKTWVARYHNAMPQYHVGHLDRVSRIQKAVKKLPGIELAGSAYHGVGIPDSVASGQAAATNLLSAAPTR